MKVLKVFNNITNWFYGTYLGGLYFEFLLWLDRRNKPSKLLTPKEMAQIVRESNKTYDGVSELKSKVRSLVESNTSEEYHKTMCEIEDMMSLSYGDPNSDKAKFASLLRNTYDLKKIVDIENNTERAKMVDKRIEDMHELHNHIAKRNLLREIRSARVEGNSEQANKLEQEFLTTYGRSNSRYRKS